MEHAKRKSILKTVYIASGTIACLVFIVLISCAIRGSFFKDPDPADTAESSETSAITEITSKIVSTEAETTPITTESATSTAPEETESPENSSNAPAVTDAPSVPSVPSIEYSPSPDRDTDFSGCLFIGNSRTEGLMLYSGVRGATAYAARGMSLPSYFTTPAVNLNGNKVSASEAVASGPDYDRVYIMLGINEIGWLRGDSFYEAYGKVIDHVKECMPDAEIIVQSIIPVTASRSAMGDVFNNVNISEHNDIIKKLCEDKGVTYMDLTPALCGEYTALPEDAAFDGIHLQKPYCQKWLDHLRDNK